MRNVASVIVGACAGLLMLLVAATGGIAQQTPQTALTMSVSHRGWTKQMGAPTFVQSITQDKQGFLWVGSLDGLFRFDGVSFEPIMPPAGHKRTALAVTALATSPDGDIWIGYGAGGGVAVFRESRALDAKLPEPGEAITGIAIDSRGAPWVINSGGGGENILRRVGDRWVPVHAPDGRSFNDVVDLELASDGSMWAYAAGRIYVARSGADRFVATGITGDEMGDLSRDPSGQMLLSEAHGVRRVQVDRSGLLSSATRVGTIPAFNKLSTLVDRQGVLWGTTYLNGAFFGPLGAEPAIYSEAQGITSARTAAIYLDRSGNVWTGGEGGLDRFSKPVVEVAPGLPTNPQNSYKLVVDTSGQVRIVAGETIWTVSGHGGPTAYATLSSMPYGACGDRRGVIWTVMDEGLAEVRDGRETKIHKWPVEPIAAPFCIVREDSVVHVVVPGSGLFQLRAGAWHRVRLPSSVEDISDLGFDPKGRMVLVVNRKSVALVDGSKITSWNGERIGFEQPTSISFLSGDTVIGGLTGLLRLREGRVSKLDFEIYPWLRDTRALVATNDGYVWLMGFKGISRVKRSDLEKAFDRPGSPIPYQLFDDDNATVGIPQRASGPQAAVDRDGIAWFLTRQRVFRVYPDREPAADRPAIIIKSATIDGSRITDLAGLTLPGGLRTASFDFGVADLTTPTHRRFRYRVDGYDNGWIEIGGRRQINLTRLGPGSYNLRVETDNEKGEWVAPGAELKFAVRPLLHQTWWFRTLAVLSAVAIVWLLARWRIRAAEGTARRDAEGRVAERTRIARDLHDTFLQGFQGSALRLQAVAERLPEESRERQGLENVLRGVDGILEEGRRRVQSLRSEDVPLSLDEALGALASDVLGQADIGWSLETTGRIRLVAADVADEALLIVREALINVVRHAQATTVQLTLQYRRSNVELSVRDDGIGLPVVASNGRSPSGHFGLTGMHERAGLIEAAVEIAPSNPGTRVTLIIPARKAYSAAKR
ncbi:two-component regulator propeller domain-containing protein (plasmid) [Novosphingobium resinovorum]|uniref:sensor histidine kinase n=1 Tax=Novosphingobium TaxID=165696 RepID=UPI001B3CA1C2|nr:MULTISPECIES: sensor histidine kinase [Novosphingobium]MBF7015675.1 ATP-binding protein [Novosphingobium sp. HR1a]WJM29668.1 two-component regulator propeller domain-containing protein [Novosphingobium resinovorum]